MPDSITLFKAGPGPWVGPGARGPSEVWLGKAAIGGQKSAGRPALGAGTVPLAVINLGLEGAR